MKKLILLTVFFCCILMQCWAIEVHVKGRIGRRSNGCQGLGLCLHSDETAAGLSFHLQYYSRQGQLDISFDDKELMQYQPETGTALHSLSTFPISEMIVLDPSWTKQLGIRSTQISAGEYALTKEGSLWTIHIPL